MTPHIISQTVNIGDAVNFTVFSDFDDLQWRHNGDNVNTSLNGKKTFTIATATAEHAGIYECHLAGRRRDGNQAIFQLVVRGLYFEVLNTLELYACVTTENG